MSRTFRRRHTTQNGMWSDFEYYTSERVYPFESYGWYRSSVLVPFERGSKEGSWFGLAFIVISAFYRTSIIFVLSPRF